MKGYNIVNRILIVVVLLVVSTKNIYGQQDTIFLDRKFQVTESENYSYFRIAEPKTNGNYLIKDYYKSGQLQMVGVSNSLDDKQMINRVVRYNHDGSIQSICDHKNYTDGWITFYNKENQKTASLWCIDSRKNGKANFYDEYGKIISKGKFKNDVPYEGKMPAVSGLRTRNTNSFFIYKKGERVGLINYYENNERSVEVVLDDLDMKSAVYFFSNGKKAGKGTFEDDRPFSGIHLEFEDKIMYSFKPSAITYRSLFNNGRVEWRESYVKNKKIATCEYRNGYPYEGKLLEKNKLVIFKQGKECNEVQLYDEGQGVFYNRYTVNIDGFKNGTTTFINPITKREYKGTYKDNDPENGYIYENSSLHFYKNGLKEDSSIVFNKSWGVQQKYSNLNDKKHGLAFSVATPTKDTIWCVYREGKPFDGRVMSQKSRYIVQEYLKGELVKEFEYSNKNNNTLRRVEGMISNGKVEYYDENGQLWLEGEKQDGKPWNGQFLKIKEASTYKNGRLNGVKSTYDYNITKLEKTETFVNDTLEGLCEVFYPIEAKGYYKKGKPFEGRFYENKILFSYQNGKKEGTVQFNENGLNCSISYKKDLKEGNSFYQTYMKPLTVELKYLNDTFYTFAKDTFSFKLVFKDDKPFEGIEFNNNKLSQYKNGILEGYQLLYKHDNLRNQIKSVIHFKAGELSDTSFYFFDNLKLFGVYEKGIIMEGYDMPLKSQRPGEEIFFPRYNNGVASNIEMKGSYPNNACIMHDDKPWSGVYTDINKYPFMFKYGEGVLQNTFILGGIDTISNTFYYDHKSVTKDRNGEITAKGVYTDSTYSTGTISPIGGNKYSIKNNFLSDGCMLFDDISSRFFGNFDTIKVCQIDTIVTVTSVSNKHDIYTEMSFISNTFFSIPTQMNMAYFYGLSDLDHTTKTYLRSNNKLLTTGSKHNYSKTGSFLEQDKNTFKYLSYDDESFITEKEFNLVELLEFVNIK